MNIEIILPDKLQSSNLNIFIDIIYDNFIELSNFSHLNHTKQQINTLLKSNNARVFLLLNDDKIISYVVGEIMILNDARNVFYITYIFTADKFRKQGVGSKMMEFVEKFSKKHKLNTVILTCDTHNDKVLKFYEIKGYEPDILLKNYTQHEVMSKLIL